ncbi:YfmQ family protein [Rossellomorea pakistanensis]|uniref:YfmQ family protein n=1 Tax=Rossellomorea pakistanensis TaxID=992288 RepID=UPI003AEFD780
MPGRTKRELTWELVDLLNPSECRKNKQWGLKIHCTCRKRDIKLYLFDYKTHVDVVKQYSKKVVVYYYGDTHLVILH